MTFQITRGQRLRPQKVVLYGPEGVGKTTLAAAPTSWQMLLD